MAKVQMKVSGVTEGLTSTIHAGMHTFYVDEPAGQGGNDKGPNPLQTVLGGLIGCENIIANMVAKKIGFEMQGLSFTVKGELNTSGFMGDQMYALIFKQSTFLLKLKRVNRKIA